MHFRCNPIHLRWCLVLKYYSCNKTSITVNDSYLLFTLLFSPLVLPLLLLFALLPLFPFYLFFSFNFSIYLLARQFNTSTLFYVHFYLHLFVNRCIHFCVHLNHYLQLFSIPQFEKSFRR